MLSNFTVRQKVLVLGLK